MCERYTIGHMRIDEAQFRCDTIEDKVRDVNRNGKFDNGEKKIAKVTAIPFGTYEVSMHIVSPSYSKKKAFAFTEGRMPRLLEVPEFSGVLIHTGNTEEDSAGCIIVGENKVVGKVINSTQYEKTLVARCAAAIERGESITIEIV